MKKVSIIMPVHNAECYLKDSIEDIIKQTYDNWELICVDDGSTDASSDILNDYSQRDYRIRVINTENNGAGAARNKGITLISGEYTLFLDSDDRFSDELIRKAVSKAEETNADIVCFGAERFDGTVGLYNDEYFSKWILNTSLVPSIDTFSYLDCPDNIFQISPPVPWNKIYRTGLFAKEGILFQEYPYNNDSYFVCIALCYAKRITTISDRLVLYRTGNKGKISSSSNKLKRPELNFEMFLSIRNKCIEINVYEMIWRSLAKCAAEQLENHAMSIDESNYNIFLKYYDGNYILDMRLDLLTLEDVGNKRILEDISCIMNRGGTAFIARSHRRVSEMAETLSHKKQQFDTLVKRINIESPYLPQGKRIVLYGAGERGEHIFERICDSNTIVAWVDKNKENCLSVDGRRIIPISKLCEFDFDYIWITIGDDIDAICARQDLETTVNKDRIIW